MHDFVCWLPCVLSNLAHEHDIQLEVDKRLREIDPRLRWEIGPHGEHDRFFAFSPNFYDELLPVTEALVEAMPAVEGWHFLTAKPKKYWSTREVRFKDVEYCMDDWRYRLVAFKGGEFFDIDFFTFNDAIEERVREWLGVFLASSELGEKLFMRAIDRVNVSTRPGLGEKSIPVGSLYEQIGDLFTGKLVSE